MAENLEKVTISIKEWWSHEWKAASLAGSKMGWRSLFMGATAGVLAYVAQYKIGLRTMSDTLKMVLTSLGAAVAVFIAEFAWRLFVAPAMLLKSAEESHKKDAENAATQLEKERKDHASEKAIVQGRLDALQKEKDEHPKLRIMLKTTAVRLSPQNQHWQALVEVCNTSKIKDAGLVELLAELVTPDAAVEGKFRPEVELAPTLWQPHQQKVYMVDVLKPSHSASFAVVVGTSNMVCLGVRPSSSSRLDLMKFNKISIALKASGSMTEPSYALLVLTGTGETNSTCGLTLSQGQ